MTTARKAPAANAAPFLFIVGRPNLWHGAMDGDAIALAAMGKADAVATAAPFYGSKPDAAHDNDNLPDTVQARADWDAHKVAVRTDAEGKASAVMQDVLAAHVAKREIHVLIAYGSTGGTGKGYATVAAPESVRGFVMALAKRGAVLHVLPALAAKADGLADF